MELTQEQVFCHLRNAMWKAAEKTKNQRKKNVLTAIGYAIAHAQESISEVPVGNKWNWDEALINEIVEEVSKQ